MGIRVTSNTKKRATLKMYNALGSYLFEQECDELSSATSNQKKVLREARKVLGELIK